MSKFKDLINSQATTELTQDEANLASNEAFVKVAVDQAKEAIVLSKLRQIESQLESCQNMADLHRKDGSARKFRKTKVFRGGEHFRTLFSILNGLRYAPEEIKPRMNAIANIPETLVANTLDSILIQTRFDPTTNSVSEGTCGNKDTANTLLKLCGIELSLVVQPKITQVDLNNLHQESQNWALTQKNLHEAALLAAKSGDGFLMGDDES
jgi:hypothetical protein